MREMQDSGLIWLGKIPTEWSLTKIGGLYSIRNEKVSDKDFPPLSVTNKGILPQLETAAKTNDGDNRKLVRVGDFAINSRSDRRGSCGISPYNGSVSLINIVMMPRKEMIPTYYEWLFHTTQFGDENYRWGHGIVDDLWTTGWQEMKKITIPRPPLEEQKRIADYLDTKCAEIDALTVDIQSQIETLEQYKRSIITEAVTKGLNPESKTRNSGIFYMAPMNTDWRLTKIGYICTKLSRPFNPEDTALICSNQGKVLIRPDNVTGIMVSEDHAMQGIHKGDIAIHGMDTWHGAIGMSAYNGKITRVVHVCDSTEDKRLIVYYLQHLAFQGVYKLISNGVRGNTSDFRSWDKVCNICIAIPKSKQEQQEICDYLDNVCSNVDEIIATKKEQLTILDAYKKSLIYEYVTGKKAVPEVGTPIEAVIIDPHVIMAGMIIDRLGHEQKGKIQIQKLLYLFDTYLGMNLNTQYYRYNHGPYDRNLDNYLNILVANGWFQETSNGAIKYKKGPNHDEFCSKYKDAFAEYSREMSKLMSFVKGMKQTSQIERIATAFAVWNDLILDGNSLPTDDEIIREIRTNWTPNKAHSPESTWKSDLEKMKRQGIVPHGQGLHTLPMPKRGVCNE